MLILTTVFIPGSCSQRGPQMHWNQTTAGLKGFSSGLSPATLVYTPAKTVIVNGDICYPGSWVIYTSEHSISRVGQVINSVQILGSLPQRIGKCSFIVIAPAISSEKHDHYWMPRLQLHSVRDWEAVAAEVR